MDSLTITEYERAKDGTSLVFRDTSPYGTGDLPTRDSVALVVTGVRLQHQADSFPVELDYLLRSGDGGDPEVFTLAPAAPQDADAVRLPLAAGIYQLAFFAVPLKAPLLETSGTDFIGNLYFDALTEEVVKLVASRPAVLTDAYAVSYGYGGLLALQDAETAAAAFLVPHFLYDFEPVTELAVLRDQNFAFSEVYVQNQQPYRALASQWWMSIHRRKNCLNGHERQEFEDFMFDLQGACMRFEDQYYDDAVEILQGIEDRVPTLTQH